MFASIQQSWSLIALALLTLCALLVYDYLPEKTWHWLPDSEIYGATYSDHVFGGQSKSVWQDERRFHMSCDAVEAGVQLLCGMSLRVSDPVLPGKDLSSYNTVLLDIDYVGPNKKLRIYLNEFVPGFTSTTEPLQDRKAKYMGALVPVSETDGVVALRMSEFRVADWWVDDQAVPREFTHPSRKQVMAFGVDVSPPALPGHHEIKINRVTFKGVWVSKENWYQAIVLMWVSVILGGAAVRYYLMKKSNSVILAERDQYRELSMQDPLTGLLNRAGLMRFYQDHIAEGHCAWPVSTLLIDIDHFKNINDTFGHSTGDEVIKRVADKLLQLSRDSDKIARWGGEEFLILLPGVTHREARNLAERLRLAVMEIEHPEMPGQTVTISQGVGELDRKLNFEDSFRSVDESLYQAKESGRNCVV